MSDLPKLSPCLKCFICGNEYIQFIWSVFFHGAFFIMNMIGVANSSLYLENCNYNILYCFIAIGILNGLIFTMYVYEACFHCLDSRNKCEYNFICKQESWEGLNIGYGKCCCQNDRTCNFNVNSFIYNLLVCIWIGISMWICYVYFNLDNSCNDDYGSRYQYICNMLAANIAMFLLWSVPTLWAIIMTIVCGCTSLCIAEYLSNKQPISKSTPVYGGVYQANTVV